MNKDDIIAELEEREKTCWSMARVFLDQYDYHGMHDMGVEIAALRRAIDEVERVRGCACPG